MYVRATVQVTPRSAAIRLQDVAALGPIVEQRCPIAAMLVKAGVKMEFCWTLDESGRSDGE
jgi:hypothetical protein